MWQPAQLPDTVLEAWSHTVHGPGRTLVLPDGCEDVILLIPQGGPPQWLITDLADSSYSVPHTVGDVFFCFRFHPGCELNKEMLQHFLAKPRYDTPCSAVPILAQAVRRDPQLAEALQLLAMVSRVSDAAKTAGTSERTFERLVHKHTQRPPSYWLALARVRRAGVAVNGTNTFADIAAQAGYADQAHMTRAFRRWFSLTPGGVLRSPEVQRSLCASGY